MAQIVETIRSVRKKKGNFDVLLNCLEYGRSDLTWELTGVVIEDISRVVKNYMNAAVEKTLKRKILHSDF